VLLATIADLRLAFGHEEVAQLAQPHAWAQLPEGADTEEEAAAVAAVLNSALDRASSEAASYLAGRYPVFARPALPDGCILPPALVSVVCDIARYRLTGAGTVETDPIVERYKWAIAWLKDISAGRAELLLILPEEEGQEAPLGGVSISSGVRDWSGGGTGDDDE
jgi:phage gp36-like protein